MIHGSRKTPLTATYVKRRALLGASVVLALLAVWGVHHVVVVNQVVRTGTPKLAIIYVVLFVMLCWQTFYGYLEKPHTVTSEQWGELQTLKVAVLMPLYNEDPKIAQEAIESMLRQTRPLQFISVVDDGSNKVDYYDVEQWFHSACYDEGIVGYWNRTPNQGKRHAQMAAKQAIEADGEKADVYACVDSDSLLDPYATEEALKPFADPEVMSVASMVAAANTKQNIFTRVMDLWYVALQFTDRSIMSRFNSVLVNYGALAYYRASVLDDNVDIYLNETFGGRKMSISDDSLLTLFALLKGKTVQQITSWAFTYMPTTFKHHKNQQIRWMRGSFIRSMWRFRYLPMGRFAFWAHLAKWLQYALATAAFVGVVLTHDLTNWKTVGLILVIQACIYYGVMLRYLTLRRSDESSLYQLGTWAMTPVAAMWAMTVLRVWRWWAMFTCANMAWGTRSNIEVVAGIGAHRTKPVFRTRYAVAGLAMVAAFLGTGWFVLNYTTPNENSILAQADRAGISILPQDLYKEPRQLPSPTPSQTPQEATPEPTRTRVRVRPIPVPTRTTPSPSASPTTARPTPPRITPPTRTTAPTTAPPTTVPPTSTSPTPSPSGTTAEESFPPIIVIPITEGSSSDQPSESETPLEVVSP